MFNLQHHKKDFKNKREIQVVKNVSKYLRQTHAKTVKKQGTVAHAYRPSTAEAVAGGSAPSEPAASLDLRETLSQRTTTIETIKRICHCLTSFPCGCI